MTLCTVNKGGFILKVAIIGAGYVGTTTGVAFAYHGHTVTLVEKDVDKIAKLQQSQLPFYEEGLECLLKEQMEEQRLTITSHVADSIKNNDIIVIAVGTPSLPGGGANLAFVEEVAREISRSITNYTIIATKSTVPVGTGLHIKSVIQEELHRLQKSVKFDVVSIPEFLREGKALTDALYPDRIVIGHDSSQAKQKMKELYHSYDQPKLYTTLNDAEMIKYASNAFLATKISFVNELARLCEHTGANITEVAIGMGLDPRIGNQFLQAGIGYGGSCFPKDLQALIEIGSKNEIPLTILEAVTNVNQSQHIWFLEKVKQELGPLKGKRIALLGMSFKPGTDDIREAVSLKIIHHLLEQEALVSAFDPQSTNLVRSIYPQIDYKKSPLETVHNADAVLLVTEWDEIVNTDWEQVSQLVNRPLLFDGRNALSSHKMKALGFTYYGVGLTQ